MECGIGIRIGTKDTNTKALNILTVPFVIASPKGVAISPFMGLLRPPHQGRGPRNDKLFVTFALIPKSAIRIPKLASGGFLFDLIDGGIEFGKLFL